MNAENLRSLMSYDQETGVFRWVADQGPAKAGSEAGTIHHRGYRSITFGGRKYLAHRLAWLYVHGHYPQTEIDHINGDKADNRIVNLREATRSENQANKPLSRNNTSGHKGVVWSAATEKWQAQISIDGKLHYLGQFLKVEEAAAAYRSAAQQRFGQFARMA